MKKTTKIFGGIFLLALFAAAVVLFFKLYLTEDKEEEEATHQLSVTPSKQVYELGEDMEVEGVLWNISEAELIDDYEKIDSFYKEREFLLSREDYVKEYIEMYIDRDLFVDDIRYFRIKGSVTNNANKDVLFSPDSMAPISIIGSDMVSWYFCYCYDIQSVSSMSDRGSEIQGYRQKIGMDLQMESYSIQPDEKIEFEVIGELSLCSIYSLYDMEHSDGNYDLYFMVKDSTKRVHLNIAGSFDGNQSYQEARNIQTMKSQSWTNLEQMEWEKELAEGGITWGYRLDQVSKPISETEEPGQEFLEFIHGGVINDEVVNAFSLVAVLTDFNITEWKDMPSDFAEQGNLQKMAQRYYELYHCQEEDLKVLVLDLNYISSEMGVLMDVYKTAVNYFYGRSKLYVKDEENTLWLFGTADSWIVTENSAHPENIGDVNLDIMELDASISVRMAYILPPQLYEQYFALYFSGGNSEIAHDQDYIPMTRITLK